MSDVQLTRNDDESRYELRESGDLIGLIDYREKDGVTTMYHTEVNPEHGGKGHGSRLVKFALDDAREQGLRVQPTCPFIAKYIDENPGYQDLRFVK